MDDPSTGSATVIDVARVYDINIVHCQSPGSPTEFSRAAPGRGNGETLPAIGHDKHV